MRTPRLASLAKAPRVEANRGTTSTSKLDPAFLLLVIIFISHQFAYDPIHLGMVMVIATRIGSTTPPVAVGLFVATSVVKTSYDQTLTR